MLGCDIVGTSKQIKTKAQKKQISSKNSSYHVKQWKYSVEKEELMIVDEEGDAQGHPQA